MDDLFQVIPVWQFTAFAAVFGAMWGSFANVVIVRWPEGLSVVRPASHCPSCKKPIPFYDNIPVFSYLILLGKCRNCKESFSPRYAVVELAMALLSVGVLRMTLLADPPTFLFGLTEYVVWFAFMWALLTAGIIDLETFLLPDAVTLPGIVIGLLVNSFVLKTGWMDPLIAAVGGFAVISLLFVHGYKLLTGQNGMGEGDPKLIAMIGAFLGMKGAMFALFAAAFQGLVIGSILVVYRRRTGTEPEPPFDDDELDEDRNEPDPDPRFRKARVPFGPFLALGAMEYYFVGDTLLGLYLDGVAKIMGLG
ncbi:MAG: prepilin peptidase [Proteobacteria bacterium]|nr:prepilin peptidase [Pseudomonadota bacterium]